MKDLATYPHIAKNASTSNSVLLEQMNIENVYLLCKDLLVNPCHEFVARRIYFAVSNKLKVKMLY
jgi:hypothetical protein